MKKEILYFENLIIGSGIAGLYAGLNIAKYSKVTIITKCDPIESNTFYAQGGIAGVFDNEDSILNHINDTLKCGSGLCNEEIVKLVVKNGADRILDLANYNIIFEKDKFGKFDLHLEGGHSAKRIVHSKDKTGKKIQTELLNCAIKNPNISLKDNYFALELITKHHLGKKVTRYDADNICYGVYVYNVKENVVETWLSNNIILATGGSGNIYEATTNSSISTGDGVAMAYRAKCIVENMEFFQFHPTALYEENTFNKRSFLISEAVRGAGGILINSKQQQFMNKFHELGSLAPRDIVARAIDLELKKTGKNCVFIDCTKFERGSFKSKFPTIYIELQKKGIDPEKDLIPVVPAAHYQCGGIKTDAFSKTNIINLYAIGECASTGLHGANRLASNSLLEGLVFGYIVSKEIKNKKEKIEFPNTIPQWDISGTSDPEEMVLIHQSKREVQSIMTNYVGIVRTNIRLKRALDRLNIIYQETEEFYKRTSVSIELCELRNIINVAYIIIKFAYERKESVGLHYNLDFPNKK